MNLKKIATLCMACAAFTAAAQTHLDGAEYYKADQIDNAKDLLLRSLNNPQTDKSVSDYYLGLIALQEGKKSDAAKYFADGIAANPDNGYNYVGQGELQLMAGDAKGAEGLFKTAEKLAKKDAGVSIAIARAYDRVDPLVYEKQINKAVEKARKVNMQHPDIYLFEGDVLRAQKDWGGAAGKYEMAANYDNNATQAYVKYANLFTMVNPDFAIKMLQNLLKVNPNSALGQRELANAYYNKKDYVKAAEEFGKYVKNPSHFKQDEDRYAFLLFYGGDYQKGYDYATQLLASNPKHFTAQRYQYMNAANIPAMKEQLLPMAEKLYAAHKADPKNNQFAAIDYILISGELQEAKRPEEAVQVLEEAIREMPDNSTFNKQLASIYVDENDLAKAADSYQEYLNKTDNAGYNDFVQQAIYAYYGGAQNIQADPAKSQKYFDMSTKYANMARELADNQYKPVKILGDIAIAQAPNDEARKSAGKPLYEEAIALLEAAPDPAKYKSDAKTIYSYLGNYYAMQKDNAKAREYFNKYLTLDPGNQGVIDFVNRLK